MKKNQFGFTLIELMIVVVIVAILAMIALPGYQDFVRKSRRSEAISEMLDIQLQEEKWRANNSKYAVTSASVGAVNTSYYTFVIAGSISNPNVYTLTATPQGKQAQDKQYGVSCNPMTINQSNDKTPAECWRK